MAVKRVCDYSFTEGLFGTSYVLNALTYLDENGILQYFLGPVDMNDINALETFMSNKLYGKFKYSVSSSQMTMTLHASPYKLFSLEFIFIDNTGTPNIGSYYFSSSRCRYMHDPSIVRGCTDSDAENYLSTATESNDTCVYTPVSDHDKFLQLYSNYAKEKSRSWIRGKGPCCCDLDKELFFSEVVKITQRVFNNTSVLSPEVKATALVSFASFDTNTLDDNLTIYVGINFENPAENILLTSFTGDFEGFTLEAFLTLLVLNINLDSPDFSASYSGSGTDISIIAADDYGASINNAEINFYITGVYTVAADAEEVNAVSSPTIIESQKVGGSIYVTPGSSRWANVTDIDNSNPLITSAVSHLVNTGAASTWHQKLTGHTYKGYQRANGGFAEGYYIGTWGTSPYASVQVVKGGAHAEKLVYFDGASSVGLHTPLADTVVSYAHPISNPDMLGVGFSAAGDLYVLTMRLDFGSGNWKYSIITINSAGSSTVTGLIDSGFIDGGELPTVYFHAATYTFYVVIKDKITIIDPVTSNIITQVTTALTYGDVLVADPVTGHIIVSSSVLSVTGTSDIYLLDQNTHSIALYQSLAITIIGPIGVKTSGGVIRFYACQLNNPNVKEFDAGWNLTGNHILCSYSTVNSLTAGYPVACYYDNQNDMIMAVSSENNYNLLSTAAFHMIGIYDPSISGSDKLVHVAPLVNFYFRGGAKMDVDLHNGVLAYRYYSSISYGTFVDRSDILAQLYVGGNDNPAGAGRTSLVAVDILSDGTIAQSAFGADFSALPSITSYLTSGCVIDSVVRTGTKRLILRQRTGHVLTVLKPNYRLISTHNVGDGATLGINSVRLMAVNPTTGIVATFGTPYAGGIKIVLIDPAGGPFQAYDISGDFDDVFQMKWNDQNLLCVVGEEGGTDKLAIYDQSMTLQNATSFHGSVEGSLVTKNGEIDYDSQNQAWIVSSNTNSKINIFTRAGVHIVEFDLLGIVRNWTLTSVTLGGVLYGGAGTTYGVGHDSSGSLTRIYRIFVAPNREETVLGEFLNGYDAILQTENDECLTFEETNTLLNNSTQLIKNCDNEN